jgi:type IV secretory pathway VirD2 relaxase
MLSAHRRHLKSCPHFHKGWNFTLCILSPEFGDKLNMQALARGLMAHVEKEIGAGLEWIAVAHYNTGHPHVHVAMRGIHRRGREIRLPKEFV